MTDENQMVPNLWGEQVYLLPRKKGRPPFEWTQENSNKVSMLLAAGWSNDRIAGCVLDPRTGSSISVKTLQRYFRRELAVRDTARDQLLACRLMQTFEAAQSGNVGAGKHFDQLIEKNDLALTEARMRRTPQTEETSKETAAARLGKKEAAQQEAEKIAETSDLHKPGFH